MPTLPYTPVSTGVSSLLGITQIRAQITPVIDLHMLLTGQRGAKPERFVTVRMPASQEGPARTVALAVDQVSGVRKLPAGESVPLPPLVRSVASGMVEEIASLDKGDKDFLLVLSSARLVPKDVWMQVQEWKAA